MLEVKIMDFKNSNLELLIIPVCQDLEIHTNSYISDLITAAKKIAGFKAEKYEVVTIFHPLDTAIKRVVFFGLGEVKTIDLQFLRSFGGKATTYCIDFKIAHMVCAMPSYLDKFTINCEEIFNSIMEGIVLSNDVFDFYKKTKTKIPLSKVTLAVLEEKQLKYSNIVSKVEAKCSGTVLARQWVNTPANEKKPKYFAKLIQKNAVVNNIKIDVFDKKWLIENKFGGILAVGQGSTSSPCLVVMEHKPLNVKKKILLVGKGVTFDSGGINLKPSTGLEQMKTDMAGAAAVAATLIAISKLKLDNHVVGILPLVENMLSGSAICPGDIIRSFSGKTVEISNTDAEGRLILADSLAWGICEYKPDIAIDIATLTGACAVALGDKIAGVFSTNKNLANSIIKAGNKTFERCWQMPLPEDYRELLKSDLSDLNNISSSKWGGAITAAMFLSEFVGEVPWAHIDIAGPARTNKKTDYCSSGATGFGVRLLCELVENL